VFSILLDNSNIANYQGLFFTRAIPYIEIFGVWQSSPYEAVCIAGQPFSGDAQPFVAIPHHAITPYPATVNATTPVAAYQVTCTLTNIELLTANTFTAAANCYTPDEVAFNKNGILTGTYFQNPLVANQYHVTYSAFVTSNTDQFLLDATSVILPIN
jgi:hypothetical protein